MMFEMSNYPVYEVKCPNCIYRDGDTCTHPKTAYDCIMHKDYEYYTAYEDFLKEGEFEV